MAHQCLKCGETYPDGSPQILRGCEGCKGTRFFYTDQPLAETERAELAEQAEIDLERLALGKGAKESGAPRHLPTKGESFGRGEDWVAARPNDLRNIVEDVVRRAGERKPVFRIGESPPSLQDWVASSSSDVAETPGTAEGPDEGLLDDLFTPDREDAWRNDSHLDASDAGDPDVADVDAQALTDAETPVGGGPPEAEVVYKRAPRPIPKPVSLTGIAVDAQEDAALREAARKVREAHEAPQQEKPRLNAASGVDESLYPEGQAPETVAVRDGGVYELDVKRLLEKNPLVVHKDGSYSLHLPSLMETLERKRQR